MNARDAAIVRQLYREYEAIIYHFGLPAMRAVLQVAPLTRHWGHWDPTTRTITLAVRLIEEHGWDVVVEVLKHEMAHQWVSLHHADAAPHGAAFTRACDMLGLAPWAAAASGVLPMSCAPGGHREVSAEEARLLAKVEKLLNLATSSNAHEAGLAMQRARQILARYNLASTVPPTPSDWTYAVVHRRRRRTCRIESMVVALLVEHFDVRAVHTALFDKDALCEWRAVELLGEHRHVALAEHVYHFLLDTVQGLYERHKRVHPGVRVPRMAYMTGVMLGFGEKLTRLAEDDVQAGPDAARATQALVRTRARRLRAYVQTRHPKLQTRRLGGGRLDAGAVHAGKKAGRDIVLHRAITGHANSRGRLLGTSRC